MKKEFINIKCQIGVECSYERTLVNKETQFTTMIFNNKCLPGFDNINNFITENFNELKTREQSCSPNAGSGWSFLQCNRLFLKLNKYTPLNAGKYIDLPKSIKKKKACINFKNKDLFYLIK